MSFIVGSLQRLEEFPAFVSCIRCFGRSIIPPLVTQNQRYGFQKIREAAAVKEAEILKRKLDLQANMNPSPPPSAISTDSDLECSSQETCALWCPSSKDHQEHVSVAISKFPTNSIYSSVHTDAIVCADLIERSGKHHARINIGSSENVSKEQCQCSHSIHCDLCQVEYDQTFHKLNFISEVSPEVPCRTYSLIESSLSLVTDDQNSVAETDCESLRTVIYSQKPDTDTESSATCLTQSTDLDKYMELSCGFNSSDNSTTAWDSQSTSQQFTMSRSDDASSGTIVNTENELTPCASTLAEFTDNIEDELSNAEEFTNHDNPVKLKRAHSIDSYMKIIHSCARSLQVKKSSSEPLNTKSMLTSSLSDNIQVSSNSKTSQLIKEDSKESEESKDLPERDVDGNEIIEPSLSISDVAVSDVDDINVFHKKHVRKNSYTLDHPSPVLIQAHAECNCCSDNSTLSPPHCFALEVKDVTNSAFVKEKVNIKISESMHNFPILTPTTMVAGNSTSSVVDVFPRISEDRFKKSDYENTNEGGIEVLSLDESLSDIHNLKSQEKAESDKLLATTLSGNVPNEEYYRSICKEIQERYEARMKELLDEQNRQWLKFREELQEQERYLYENLKQSVPFPPGESLKTEAPALNRRDSVPEKEITFNHLLASYKNGMIAATNDSPQYLEQNAVASFSVDYQSLSASSQNDSIPSYLSKMDNSKDSRALSTPSKGHKSPHSSPSLYNDTSPSLQLNQNSCTTCHTNESCNDICFYTSDSHCSEGQFSSQNAVLLPQCDSQTFSVSSNVDLDSPCCCEQSVPQCSCFDSSNGYKENIYQSSNRAAEKNFSSSHPNLHTSSSNYMSDNQNYPELQCVSNPTHLTLDVITDAKQGTSSNISRDTKSSSDILQTSKSTVSQNIKSISLTSLKDKTGVPVDDIISRCVKSVKNGSVPTLDVYIHKEIEIHPSILKRFEKLPAFVKGYLTRRLFKTERVQGLIKTLQDTAVLIRKLSEDLAPIGDGVSERDVDFHRQLIVLLMSTFHNVYDIFCTISTKERMSIITESRNLKIKKKKMEQNLESGSVTAQAPVSDLSIKEKSVSTNSKTLSRKKKSDINSRTYTVEGLKNLRTRSDINSRTYTVEDLKNLRTRSAIERRTCTTEDLKSHVGRPRSQASSKNHPVSPSSIYKTSVSLAHKRKSVSCKTSNSRRSIQFNWVP